MQISSTREKSLEVSGGPRHEDLNQIGHDCDTCTRRYASCELYLTSYFPSTPVLFMTNITQIASQYIQMPTARQQTCQKGIGHITQCPTHACLTGLDHLVGRKKSTVVDSPLPGYVHATLRSTTHHNSPGLSVGIPHLHEQW